MTEDQVLSLFDVRADAEATNRGFSVQYLDAVRQWFEASGSDRVVYCELYDDVAVDDIRTLEREFRQIKSYKSKPLGFGDDVVKHTIYLFYRSYMRCFLDGSMSCKFSFVLDGTVRPRDALLGSWAETGTCPDPCGAAPVLRACVEGELNAIYERLKKRFKDDVSALADFQIRYNYELDFCKQCDFSEFARSIYVEVSDESVEERVALLVEIVSTVFDTLVPPQLVVARCFQEVAVRAGDQSPSRRALTQGLLASLLGESEQEMLSRLSADNVGKRVIAIMLEHGVQLTRVEGKVDAVLSGVTTVQMDVYELKGLVTRMANSERDPVPFPLINEVLTWIEEYLLNSEPVQEDRRPVDDTDLKIERNKLSEEVAEAIYETYTDFPQVRDFLRQTKGRRERFITSAIKQIYRNRRDAGQAPDDIFWGLINDITPPTATEAKRYACVVLISYFFHACEVFERVDPRQV